MYIYYSYRNPNTGKLERQTNIKAGVNLYKDKKSRYHILIQLKESLEFILKNGYNPYEDNTSLEEFIENLLSSEQSEQKETKKNKTNQKESQVVAEKKPELPTYSIEASFNLALQTKSNVLSATSYQNFKGRINRFSKWLNQQKIDPKGDISIITKKIVIQYLNTVLQNSSARNRNNTRSDFRLHQKGKSRIQRFNCSFVYKILFQFLLRTLFS
ncbi:hypothetical protein [Polaribacter sp. M15]